MQNYNKLEEMIAQHNREIEEEYNSYVAKINSGEATASDYLAAASNMKLLNKLYDKEKFEEYLDKGRLIAQKYLSSSDLEERIFAYGALAEYYKFKKNYKEALKCYDAAIDAGGKDFIILRAQLRVKHLNDRNGANKDYELAMQSGMSEEELHLFDILVKNEQTLSEKIPRWFIIAIIVLAAILLAFINIFFQ